MLLSGVDTVVFENQRDIINYITLGIPPTRKNFETLMEAIHTTYDGICVENNNSISKNIIPTEINIDAYDEILRTTYRNMVINSVGVSIGMGLLATGSYLIGKAVGKREGKGLYGNNG